MRFEKAPRRLAVVAATAVAVTAVAVAGGASQAATSSAARPSARQYLVVAKSAADVVALRARSAAVGARVVSEIPELNVLVVSGSSAQRDALARDKRAIGVGVDNIRRIAQADPASTSNRLPGALGGTVVKVAGSVPAARTAGITPDPALSYRGLQWDYGRMGAQQAWATTAGVPAVRVAVADTGLDFTHSELASKVSSVVDLASKTLCKEQFTFNGQHVSDFDLARIYGGPALTDWNGHGSWIGGNIAGALNGSGMNGIAPKVGLVALKISQWCGSAYDSEILRAFVYAARNRIDVVSISFGGYLDRSDPAQDAIYRAYVQAVAFARARGTVIVASAGNEHVRVGAGGRVISHGNLTTPGAPLVDLFGTYQVAAGIPGVVDVSATGNRVIASLAACVPGTTGSATDTNATCKPTSDRHQSPGQGRQNQLAYYSNYGPRIDIAAPGGARKFNLPVWDRGGTPGFPYTDADLTNVWEDFSITSNWATGIPCFFLSGAAGFPNGECYTAIQGTSMATPHVSAAVALAASAHPGLRHDPTALIARVKNQAQPGSNTTQPLSAADTSPGDLSGVACPTGFCHLGGAAISNADAFGAGLLQVGNP